LVVEHRAQFIVKTNVPVRLEPGPDGSEARNRPEDHRGWWGQDLIASINELSSRV